MPCLKHLPLMDLLRTHGPQVRHIRHPTLRLRVRTPPSIAAPRTTIPRPQTAIRWVLLITPPSRITPLRTSHRPRRLTHQHIRHPALRLRVRTPPNIAAPRNTTPRLRTAIRRVLLVTLPNRIIPPLRTTRRPRRPTHQHIRHPALRLRVRTPPSTAAPRNPTPRPRTAIRRPITLPSRVIPPLRPTRRPRRPTHRQPHLILPTRRQSPTTANQTIRIRSPTRHLPCAPRTTLLSTTGLALSTTSHARTGLTDLFRDSRRLAISRTSLSLGALST